MAIGLGSDPGVGFDHAIMGLDCLQWSKSSIRVGQSKAAICVDAKIWVRVSFKREYFRTKRIGGLSGNVQDVGIAAHLFTEVLSTRFCFFVAKFAASSHCSLFVVERILANIVRAFPLFLPR